jgi:signal transduction histidine kinase
MAMQATVEAMQDGVYPRTTSTSRPVRSRGQAPFSPCRRHAPAFAARERQDPVQTGGDRLVWLVKSLVTSQEQLFDDKGLQLRFADETPSQTLIADVDPDLIREAVVNLMSNAMRYTPSGGWVLVAMARRPTQMP